LPSFVLRFCLVFGLNRVGLPNLLSEDSSRTIAFSFPLTREGLVVSLSFLLLALTTSSSSSEEPPLPSPPVKKPERNFRLINRLPFLSSPLARNCLRRSSFVLLERKGPSVPRPLRKGACRKGKPETGAFRARKDILVVGRIRLEILGASFSLLEATKEDSLLSSL
jgi:hypothetical protein